MQQRRDRLVKRQAGNDEGHSRVIPEGHFSPESWGPMPLLFVVTPQLGGPNGSPLPTP